MQGPLAAVVLTLELAHFTDTLMVPILLAVTGATVVSRLLGLPSIYSARLGAAEQAQPEAEPDTAGRLLTEPGRPGEADPRAALEALGDSSET